MPQEEIQRNINNRFLHIFGAWGAILRIFMEQPFCCWCMNRNMHKYAVEKHLYFSTAAKNSHIQLKGNIWLISVSCSLRSIQLYSKTETFMRQYKNIKIYFRRSRLHICFRSRCNIWCFGIFRLNSWTTCLSTAWLFWLNSSHVFIWAIVGMFCLSAHANEGYKILWHRRDPGPERQESTSNIFRRQNKCSHHQNYFMTAFPLL